ncbi:MAG: hypothetical protein LQ340_003174 [Diploschistes diacapsis]|nr:MAG: hypothetical protein LQ340_003174 [Diploschistes diacapsis]
MLLDNTQLGPSQVSVSSAANLGDIAASAPHSGAAAHNADELDQEDKPRSRIVAEYLAHGYALSDQAISQAIALDNKHGVSSRFTSALSTFDQKFKATETAKQMDVKYGVTDKAKTGWLGLNSYFEKAMGTPTGQKLHKFYTDSNKQVQDIHAEARRLADMKGGKASNSTSTVPGTSKTTCQCGGDTGNCPCAEGKCACSGCSKNTVAGDRTATGPADAVAASTNVQPLGEKQ